MIAIVGDTHNRYDKLFGWLEYTEELIDFCLHVGDLGGEQSSYPDFPVPTYFIQGNHENWDEIEKIKNGQGPKNLHFLPNGTTTVLGGLKIMSLGGNYAPSKYNLSKNQLFENSRRHFVKSEVSACCEYLSVVDILLTHEAPSPYHRYKVRNTESERDLMALHGYNRDIGIPVVTQVLTTVRPKIHFFGHHHNYQVYEAVPGVKSVGLAYGSSEILLFDPLTFLFSTKSL